MPIARAALLCQWWAGAGRGGETRRDRALCGCCAAGRPGGSVSRACVEARCSAGAGAVGTARHGAIVLCGQATETGPGRGKQTNGRRRPLHDAQRPCPRPWRRCTSAASGRSPAQQPPRAHPAPSAHASPAPGSAPPHHLLGHPPRPSPESGPRDAAPTRRWPRRAHLVLPVPARPPPRPARPAGTPPHPPSRPPARPARACRRKRPGRRR